VIKSKTCIAYLNSKLRDILDLSRLDFVLSITSIPEHRVYCAVQIKSFIFPRPRFLIASPNTG
jgi:hypothetical protein